MPKGNRTRGTRFRLPEGWVPLSAAAKALGIPRLSLWDAINRGEVTAYREFQIGKRIFYGFRKEDLGI
jgi:hypothetical protein